MSELQTLEARILEREWFYPFVLPSGREVNCAIGAAGALHQTREKMLMEELQRHFPDGFEDLSCLDLGCNEGYYAFALAKAGFKRIVAVDLQEENLAAASMLREVYGHPNVSFVQGDLRSPQVAALGTFDVVLLLGVIYHLEDPVGALRTAHAATGRLCVVESQLSPEQPEPFSWGVRRNLRSPVGAFSVLDASVDLVESPRYVHTSHVSLVPSAHAMMWLLPAVGFTGVRRVAVPAGGYGDVVGDNRGMYSCEAVSTTATRRQPKEEALDEASAARPGGLS